DQPDIGQQRSRRERAMAIGRVTGLKRWRVGLRRVEDAELVWRGRAQSAAGNKHGVTDRKKIARRTLVVAQPDPAGHRGVLSAPTAARDLSLGQALQGSWPIQISAFCVPFFVAR